MKRLTDFLGNAKIVAVTCAQFGDTGKGKFVDIFSDWADIIARGTGGDNAGHSIKVGTKEYVFHIVPSGILRDQDGKINIIGNGTVIYPKTLIEELALLEKQALTYNHLRLALNAKLILPQHIVLDRLRETKAGTNKVGTTGKGIGPAYTDHVNRLGLIVNDLLNKDVFVSKLKRNLEEKNILLKQFDPAIIKDIMNHAHLLNGVYYEENNIFNFANIVDIYSSYGQKLKNIIADTDDLIKKYALSGKRLLLEGAQGDLLSINHGTYPFVTSSDCTVNGLAAGVGLKEAEVDLSLRIIKGFYMTRVGGGPFPTELGAEKSDSWCNGGVGSREAEGRLYAKATVNETDEFEQGIALRRAGDEYGATTGRPRRVGWLDLPLLKHVLKFGGNNIILTKLDVLNGCEKIKICTNYIYRGPEYNYNQELLSSGNKLTKAIVNAEILKHCQPQYIKFPGWQTSLENCSDFTDLPLALKTILKFIIKETEINPRILSIGPEREQTIFL